jgi:acetaldehyde dehydrogenase (acetylating)
MGPLADLRMSGENDPPYRQAIKWLDGEENDKAKLVTNKSEFDLIYKDEVAPITVHRSKSSVKATIKPFVLNMEENTGVPNIMGIESST